MGQKTLHARPGGGREGVALYLQQLKNELLKAMLLTGTADVKNVAKNILYSGTSTVF